MNLPPKTCDCPCGGVRFVVPQIDGRYDVCSGELQCPECGRSAAGGNYRTGVVDSWVTAEEREQE